MDLTSNAPLISLLSKKKFNLGAGVEEKNEPQLFYPMMRLKMSIVQLK